MGERHLSLDIAVDRVKQLPYPSSSSSSSSIAARVAASDASIAIDLEASLSSTMSECRICQEEEDVAKLETPCTCAGSLQYAHRKCLQRWCDEKGDTVCEICQDPYKGGYTSRPQQMIAQSIPIDFSDGWGMSGAHQMVIRDPRILALAAAQRQFLQSEYEEYNTATLNSAACCRSLALILMALLLLRHAIAMAASSTDEDAAMFFMIFLIRLVGFFLPCYIMARAMNMLHQREQHQATAITAAEVAALLEAGQPQSIRISMAPVVNDAVLL